MPGRGHPPREGPKGKVRSARGTAACSGNIAWILAACLWRNPAASAPRSYAPPDPVAGSFANDLRSPPETALDAAIVGTTRIPSTSTVVLPYAHTSSRCGRCSGWAVAHAVRTRWRRIVLEVRPASTTSSLGQESSGQVLRTSVTRSVRRTGHHIRKQSVTPVSFADLFSKPHFIRQRPSSSYRLSEEG